MNGLKRFPLQVGKELRLHNAKIGQIIGIEIKCVNRWSYTEILSALKDQLVGQYLRDIQSHHGILLLAKLPGEKNWISPQGKKINFREMVHDLNEEAMKFFSFGIQVQVLGIDFTIAH